MGGIQFGFAGVPTARPELPDFDKRDGPAAIASRPVIDRSAVVTALQNRLPGVEVDFDAITGSPKWVGASRGFLTGTNGTIRGASPQTMAAIPANDPHRATKAFLRDQNALFGHGPETLNAARIKRDFVTSHNEMRTVVWEQQVDGIPVFEGVLVSHTTKRGELVNIASHFVPDPDQAANAGTPGRAALLLNPPITVEQSLVRAGAYIGEGISQVTVQSTPAESDGRQTLTGAGLAGTAYCRRVWLPMNRNSFRLCWEVIFTSRIRSEMFMTLVDARSGEPMLRRCLTEQITNATYRVFNTPSPMPFLVGFPTNSGAPTVMGFSAPATNQPSEISRVLITTNALSTNASPYGWIDDTNNETMGNNVDAHLDLNADDVPDTPRPRGSPFRVFDPPIDLSQDPATNAEAAVVNLFYWCNWMHDTLYGLGFTEAAGNFQTDNFGRGGLGNDAVQADAQDGSGYNNANFSSPPDGISGRMQMFLFDGPTPFRDGAFDVAVILHEYTHGLSSRRVGGGVGISALQSRGLGEGWSDFYSLALLSQPGDDPNAAYPEGPYATYLYSGLTENYYFGIRRYPYSTDTNICPVTFKDIDPGQADSHTGIPLNSTAPASASEIHNQGEIWCATLWDARANFVNKYGFATGNQQILQLVTDGMNLCPPNPTFMQARDAIIQADLANSGGVNHQELWQAFARRGMGRDAVAPPSSTTAGVVESFIVPDTLVITPSSAYAAEGTIGGPFSPPSKIYVLHNTTTNAMDWAASTTASWINLSATNGTLPASGGSTNLVVSVNTNANGLAVGNYDGVFVITNLTSTNTQTNNASLSVSLPRIFSFSLDTDPGWPRTGEWSFGQPAGQGGFAHGKPDPTVGATGSNVFGVNLNGDYSLTPGGPFYVTAGPFDFAGCSGIVLRFQRWLNSDYPSYAYATVEVSSDGTNWTLIFQNDSGAIADAAWTRIQYDISAFADDQPAVYVRWGYEVGAGAFAYSGWNIDDIQFRGISQLAVTLPIGALEGQGVLPSQGEVSVFHPTEADVVVNLSSGSNSLVTVPATVTIPAGYTNALFNLTALDDAVLNGTRLVSISATAPGYSAGSNSLSVHDDETATLGIFLPPSATEGDGTVPGMVTISSAPVENVSVSLASSNVAYFQVPPFVVIPAGQTSNAFNCAVVDDNTINGTRDIIVSAHVENWTNGITSIEVHDNESTNITIALPAEARESNGTLTNAGRVQVAGPMGTNLVVNLVSSNTSKLSVPPTATILAGQSSAFFNLTMIAGNNPQSPVSVAVSCNTSGFQGSSTTINVIDDQTPPAPFNPRPLDFSTTNPVITTLSWSTGLGEGGEKIQNGGFESGTLTGWVTTGDSNTTFVINDGTINPVSSDYPTPPFEGNFSAMADPVSPGSSLLYRDVMLPTNSGAIMLSWADRIRNFHSGFETNQQFRVEIRATNNATLAVLFATQPGDMPMADWVQRSVNLSAFAGQTVRLAFVVDAVLNYLDVHLDEISVKCSSLAPPTFDVYFGTNAVPGVPELLGSTTNTFWELPELSVFTTYYWQVVARRSNSTPGPVWEFSALPTLLVTNFLVAEGDSGVTNAIVNVRLSHTNSQTVMVDFGTADGTAVSPDDYAFTNGTLVFNPGETNHTISIAINGNTNVEANRSFNIVFSNIVDAPLTANQITGTIVDDDSLPMIQQIQVAGDQVTLLWSAVPGRNYRVQFNGNLNNSWNDLSGDVLATGLTATKIDSTGLVTNRFYRIWRLP